jgi:Zn finger protein HypA/HybF involved in hydrogenase expression
MDVQGIWQEHGTTILIGGAALVLVFVAMKLLSPKKKVFAEGMTLNVRCRACNWQGTVTKFNQTCRKCNSSDLQQL